MITGVAIKHRETGAVFSLPKPARHDSLIRALIQSDGHPEISQEPEREWAHGIQGFVTESGEFLTRDQALLHVTANEQPTTGTPRGSILFSEDIW